MASVKKALKRLLKRGMIDEDRGSRTFEIGYLCNVCRREIKVHVYSID